MVALAQLNVTDELKYGGAHPDTDPNTKSLLCLYFSPLQCLDSYVFVFTFIYFCHVASTSVLRPKMEGKNLLILSKIQLLIPPYVRPFHVLLDFHHWPPKLAYRHTGLFYLFIYFTVHVTASLTPDVSVGPARSGEWERTLGIPPLSYAVLRAL